MKFSWPWAACFALALLGCTAASPVTDDKLPALAFFAKGDAVPSLFAQCSRASPEFVPTTYVPTPADVLDLERKLPAALARFLASEPYDRGPVTFDPEDYVRHYTAYKAAGRDMIYGSFAPHDPRSPARADQAPIVCDGGAAFFGVEYDLERHEITAMAFNGEA